MDASTATRFGPHREALRQRVCALCLDGLDDGRCGLSSRRCVLEEFLPQLVQAVLAMRLGADRSDPREGHPSARARAAVEAAVCSLCRTRDATGACSRRDDGSCALAAFFPLVVEAIEQAGRKGASLA